jgi:hypothetical protein
VSGGELAAVAFPLDQNSLNLFLLHPQPDGSGAILEDVRDVRRPVSAAGIDTVEALRVAAGIIVNLESIVGKVQLVGDLADRNARD